MRRWAIFPVADCCRRWVFVWALAQFSCLPVDAQDRLPQTAQPPSASVSEKPNTASCVKDDFEVIVDKAGSALRDLNRQNKPKFQARLRDLKTLRGWSDETFLDRAVPYVQDEKISSYDQQSTALLQELSKFGGDENDAAETPLNCALLDGLNARLDELVRVQKRKWAYMFSRLDAALAETEAPGTAP